MDFRAKPEIMALGDTEQFKRGVYCDWHEFLHFSNVFLKVIISLQFELHRKCILDWMDKISFLFHSKILKFSAVWGSLISVALSPSLSARNSSKYGQHQGGDGDWVWTTTGQCSETLMKDMLADWHCQLLDFPETWRRGKFTYLCLLLWDSIQSRC